MSDTSILDIHDILRYLPHRYPFLLVDRVTAFERDRSLTALKNVTYNEPFFVGHFPHYPVMPGVLVTEALAQATALLALHSMGQTLEANTLYYLVGIDGARFKRPVSPGDQMVLQIEQKRMSRGVGKFDARATVDGDLVASAEIMGAIREARG